MVDSTLFKLARNVPLCVDFVLIFCVSHVDIYDTMCTYIKTYRVVQNGQQIDENKFISYEFKQDDPRDSSTDD